MNPPPNTRVQRTRSSPSALRSPLTRSPLGSAIVIAGLLAVAFARVAAAQPSTDDSQPIRVVAMSVDPTLLKRSGVSIGELKTAAVEYLQAYGIRASEESAGGRDAPRLAIAIPIRPTAEGAVAFILLQYQVPARAQRDGTGIIFGTTWSRWWGGEGKGTELGSKLREGLDRLLDDFVASRVRPKSGGA